MRHAVDPRLWRGNTPLPRPTAAVPSILCQHCSLLIAVFDTARVLSRSSLSVKCSLDR